MFAYRSRKLHERDFLPLLACLEIRRFGFRLNLGVRWKVVFEQDIVRMAHTRQCHKENTRLRAGGSQLHDYLGKCHTLCFPRSQRIRQAKRKLCSSDGTVFVAACAASQHWNPMMLMSASQKGRSTVTLKIHQDYPRHPATLVLMIRLAAWRKDHAHNLALASVDEAELDGKIVSQNDQRSFCDLEVLLQACETAIVNVHCIGVWLAIVQCIKSKNRHSACVCHHPQALPIIMFAVMLLVLLRSAAEFHEHRSVCKRSTARS